MQHILICKSLTFIIKYYFSMKLHTLKVTFYHFCSYKLKIVKEMFSSLHRQATKAGISRQKCY